jgi:hypothetical protein
MEIRFPWMAAAMDKRGRLVDDGDKEKDVNPRGLG